MELRFKEVASDYDVAGGGVMYKLLMRAFPGWYRNNSVYAMYPFSTPDRTREIFHKNGLPHGIQLSYDQPQFVPPPVPVLSYKSVINVLNNQQSFKVPCESCITHYAAVNSYISLGSLC